MTTSATAPSSSASALAGLRQSSKRSGCRAWSASGSDAERPDRPFGPPTLASNVGEHFTPPRQSHPPIKIAGVGERVPLRVLASNVGASPSARGVAMPEAGGRQHCALRRHCSESAAVRPRAMYSLPRLTGAGARGSRRARTANGSANASVQVDLSPHCDETA